jgi:hypothetical protein
VEQLECEVGSQLSQSGWADRAKAIVISPELETWVWAGSPHVDDVLGWRARSPDLTNWLVQRQLLKPGERKPEHPKEAVDQALRAAHKRRSSALFAEIASKVTFGRCADPSFVKLLGILREWFPPTS